MEEPCGSGGAGGMATGVNASSGTNGLVSKVECVLVIIVVEVSE